MGAALQQFTEVDAAIEKDLVALTAVLASFIRGIDEGTAPRAVPGSLTREMISAVDDLRAGSESSPYLDFLKRLLMRFGAPPPRAARICESLAATKG